VFFVQTQAGTTPLPSASQTNVYVVSPAEGVPRTRGEWDALQRVRSQLSSQITNVQDRREELAQQLKSADPAARQGLIDRIKVIDERIIQMEKELARTGLLQQNTPLAVINTPSNQALDVFPREIAREIVPIVAILSVFVLGPMSIALSRFIWRRAVAPPKQQVLTDQATQNRLDQLQHAVDTIAIEVERISEGQRFITKAIGSGAKAPEVERISEGQRPSTKAIGSGKKDA
jgi:hypothetical protein